MKKGKKDKKIIQKVRVKRRDIEIEIKEHIRALLDILFNKKNKDLNCK